MMETRGVRSMRYRFIRMAMPAIRLTGCAALLLTAACGTRNADDATPMPEWQRATAYYAPAARIGAGNAQQLGVAWEFDDFVVRGRTHRGVQSTPVVVDGVMYVSGPWSVVYALDAKTGAEKWRYDPEVDGQFARRTSVD